MRNHIQPLDFSSKLIDFFFFLALRARNESVCVQFPGTKTFESSSILKSGNNLGDEKIK